MKEFIEQKIRECKENLLNAHSWESKVIFLTKMETFETVLQKMKELEYNIGRGFMRGHG